MTFKTRKKILLKRFNKVMVTILSQVKYLIRFLFFFLNISKRKYRCYGRTGKREA